jgi:NAD+ synthase
MDNFDAMKVKNDCVEWIREWFEHNGNNCTAVIGISGGKDSSVVAALCVEALGSDRVLGILMPQEEQSDIEDSYAVVKHLGINHRTINIAPMVNLTLMQISIFGQWHLTDQTKINLPPRIRMATLYAVSQSVNGRVANTCNLSEEYIGYSTRWGDSVGDFSPLANLTSDEVIAVGDACGLPYELTHKTPSDGLCGKTDEDNFGFTYEALNKYIRTGICEDEAVKAKIDAMHEKNLFKLMPIPTFKYTGDTNDN